mgnify:CR=1 FL=1
MNYLAEKSKKKELTEMQQIFLDNVVTTGGDLKKAAELAGYKGNHYQVIKSLKDELVDMAQNLLAHNAPKAAMKKDNIPEDYIRRATSTIPFGYETSDIQGWLQPIQEQLDSLKLVENMVVAEEISLGMATDWLEYKTKRSLSPRGLQKIIDKKYGRRAERLGA